MSKIEIVGKRALIYYIIYFIKQTIKRLVVNQIDTQFLRERVFEKYRIFPGEFLFCLSK